NLCRVRRIPWCPARGMSWARDRSLRRYFWGTTSCLLIPQDSPSPGGAHSRYRNPFSHRNLSWQPLLMVRPSLRSARSLSFCKEGSFLNSAWNSAAGEGMGPGSPSVARSEAAASLSRAPRRSLPTRVGSRASSVVPSPGSGRSAPRRLWPRVTTRAVWGSLGQSSRSPPIKTSVGKWWCTPTSLGPSLVPHFRCTLATGTLNGVPPTPVRVSDSSSGHVGPLERVGGARHQAFPFGGGSPYFPAGRPHGDSLSASGGACSFGTPPGYPLTDCSQTRRPAALHAGGSRAFCPPATASGRKGTVHTATAPQEEEPAPQPSLGELSASDVTHDSALLSWTVEEGTFDSFLLQYKDAEGKPQALPVDGGSRTVTVTNLAPSRRYKFNLYGISGRKRLGPVSTDAVT
ncbi:unnamed protein product, partial [Natator depressus]